MSNLTTTMLNLTQLPQSQPQPPSTLHPSPSSPSSPSISPSYSKSSKTLTYEKSLVSFTSTLSSFTNFLQFFQSTISTIYEKQSYRIYLNQKSTLRQYNQLVKQKEQLNKMLEDSKDYTKSYNRELIEEIMDIEKIRNQYKAVNEQLKRKINNGAQQIQNKKLLLKQLESKIKSYWVYNYGVVEKITNMSNTQSRINNIINNNNNTQTNSLNTSSLLKQSIIHSSTKQSLHQQNSHSHPNSKLQQLKQKLKELNLLSLEPKKYKLNRQNKQNKENKSKLIKQSRLKQHLLSETVDEKQNKHKLQRQKKYQSIHSNKEQIRYKNSLILPSILISKSNVNHINNNDKTNTNTNNKSNNNDMSNISNKDDKTNSHKDDKINSNNKDEHKQNININTNNHNDNHNDNHNNIHINNSPVRFKPSPSSQFPIQLFTKDTTLINFSHTKQKILNKISAQTKQKYIFKVQYETQKINLMKMFISYLKQLSENQKQIYQRIKIQKIAIELQDKVRNKQKYIRILQSLLYT